MDETLSADSLWQQNAMEIGCHGDWIWHSDLSFVWYPHFECLLLDEFLLASVHSRARGDSSHFSSGFKLRIFVASFFWLRGAPRVIFLWIIFHFTPTNYLCNFLSNPSSQGFLRWIKCDSWSIFVELDSGKWGFLRGRRWLLRGISGVGENAFHERFSVTPHLRDVPGECLEPQNGCGWTKEVSESGGCPVPPLEDRLWDWRSPRHGRFPQESSCSEVIPSWSYGQTVQ